MFVLLFYDFEQLAQKCSRRNYDRIIVLEAVLIDIFTVENDLSG